MTRTTRRAPLHRCRRRSGLAAAPSCGLAIVTWATVIWAEVAWAEVRVEGSPAAVRVTTNHDTIADVLSAFAATFDVKYRSAVPLGATADAIYSGSLAQVIARLLDGYSYVIRNDRQATEIVVVGESGAVAVPPEAPRAPPPPAIVSRWRDRREVR
jgi:hypothetical protein